MEYRVLGRTGLRISPICFGTGNFAEPTPEEEAKRMVNRALDADVNLLGTGNIYADGEGERIIGRALKENGRRQQTLIATKIFLGPFDVSHGVTPYTPFSPHALTFLNGVAPPSRTHHPLGRRSPRYPRRAECFGRSFASSWWSSYVPGGRLRSCEGYVAR